MREGNLAHFAGSQRGPWVLGPQNKAQDITSFGSPAGGEGVIVPSLCVCHQSGTASCQGGGWRRAQCGCWEGGLGSREAQVGAVLGLHSQLGVRGRVPIPSGDKLSGSPLGSMCPVARSLGVAGPWAAAYMAPARAVRRCWLHCVQEDGGLSCCCPSPLQEPNPSQGLPAGWAQ